jgi:uncharacterized phage-associated protein
VAAQHETPTALDVAEAILQRTGKLDSFKLQKLVYYAQAWHLVWENKPLFPERIEAWANGPVIPALYREHRGEFTVSHIDGGNGAVLSDRQREIVHNVVAAYGRLTGRQLARLTHEEQPWRDARHGLAPGERGNREIDLGAMFEFYSALDSDPEAELVEEFAPEPADL